MLDTTGREGDYFGMARIINVEVMLAAYAALHPELQLVVEVADEHLPENNGCYRVADGKCERLAEPCTEAGKHSIAQLTHRVITEENPLMSLMMND
jgi:predicted acetyltransferase